MRLIDADKLRRDGWVLHRMVGTTLHEMSLNNPSIPIVDAVLVRHGRWIKMSDSDGIYYACSECGNDLPRVINSFDPQFDLFPKLKSIDKTTYCPNCGAIMHEVIE